MDTKRSKSKKIGAIVFAIAMVFGIGIGTMGTAMAGSGTITGTIQGVTTVVDIGVGAVANTAANNYYRNNADAATLNVADTVESAAAKVFATTAGITGVAVTIDATTKALPEGAIIKLISSATNVATPAATEATVDTNGVVWIKGDASGVAGWHLANDDTLTITAGDNILAFLKPDGTHAGAVNTKLTLEQAA